MTMQAFRLSIGDAMALFHLLNEGVMRILTVYFEMERPQASQALEIYKMFAKITEKVVELFDIARKLRGALGIEVPIFKHVKRRVSCFDMDVSIISLYLFLYLSLSISF